MGFHLSRPSAVGVVRQFAVVVWLACLMVGAGRAAEAAPAAATFTAEQEAFFERQVWPLLSGKCLKCHGGEAKVASEFYVTSRAAVLRGGELGPAVDLKRPDDSQLLQAVRYEGLQMPPSGKLGADEVAVLARWVREGLPWPKRLEREPAHVAEKKKFAITDEDRAYWAYRPVVEPPVPQVADRAWVRNPIDAFIRAKLEAAKLSPSPPAKPRDLVRRATYDLTGLPPTPEEATAFEHDRAATPVLAGSSAPSGSAEHASAGDEEKRYAALVDRLLASPHYGEKWGRHWLDLVRYAETHGYERDSAKPFAWRYRDYVVAAFNADKPYDRFLREQLAGDELDDVTPETLTATGFYRLGTWDDEPADRELAKYDVLDGIVATTSSVALGMSLGCARCHDHKRDPLSQRDYYRLLAYFHDLLPMGRENLRRIALDAERRAYEQAVAEKGRDEARWYAEAYALEQRFLAAAEAQGVDLGAVRGSDLDELSFRLYRDTWNALPDFDELKHETAGPVASRRISLEPASRAEAIGLVFEGKLKVPQDGEYEFAATAREGVRVLVDGRAVIDRPQRGLHQVVGRSKLRAGFVPFRLEYFNAAQSPKLSLAWSGPGFKNRSLTDDAPPGPSVAAGAVWAYTTDAPPADWTKPRFDDASWRRGPAGFGTRGTPGAQVGTEWNTREIYLRRTVRMANVPRRVTLELHHDEDVEIHFNGRRVYTGAGYLRDYRRVELDEQASAALHAGENLVAVRCRQSGGGQYIDVRLTDETATLEQLVRRRGAELLGADDAARYVRLTDDLRRSRERVVAAPGIDVMSVGESGRRPTHVLLRGLPAAKGDEVTAGVPEVLAPAGFRLPPERPRANLLGNSSGRRSQLADWLTSRENPLTARVMVNRIWQFHFGRGLVGSSNDFGKLGETPTHPELLDWLAAEFVRSGWSVKHMHRLIMTSNTYRQAAQAGARTTSAEGSGADIDPGNSLLWRFNLRRLTAEEVRDSILAVTGKLDLRVGGPSVYPPIPKEVLAGQSRPGDGWPTSPPADAHRRSIYVYVKRSLQLPILATHDQADTDSSCAVRYVTTVPTQSLGMLNGEFVQEQAAAFAERLRREAPHDLEAQIRRAITLTTQREPTSDETARDAAFVRRAQSEDKLSADEALKLYCLLCLNTNEFLYLD